MNACEMYARVMEARMDMEIATSILPKDVTKHQLEQIGKVAKHYLDLCGSKFEEQTMYENMLEAIVLAMV